MGCPILPLLSSTAEFLVFNLIAQHNPKPNSKFPCGRDLGLAHSFLDELVTVESFNLRVVSYCMHGRFDPQIAQQRVASLGHWNSLRLDSLVVTLAPRLFSGACSVFVVFHYDLTSIVL